MSYSAEMLPIVNEQLQRAGFRLAAVLKAALGFPDLARSKSLDGDKSENGVEANQKTSPP